MVHILVDTNIVIDLLAKRDEFYEDAQRLFSLADKNVIKLFVSSLSFANTHYILSQRLKNPKAKSILRKFKVLVTVLPFDDKILELGLESKFKDFEDGIQYNTAIENEINIIATRNKKDFRTSSIPVLNAREIVELYLNNV